MAAKKKKKIRKNVSKKLKWWHIECNQTPSRAIDKKLFFNRKLITTQIEH